MTTAFFKDRGLHGIADVETELCITSTQGEQCPILEVDSMVAAIAQTCELMRPATAIRKWPQGHVPEDRGSQAIMMVSVRE